MVAVAHKAKEAQVEAVMAVGTTQVAPAMPIGAAHQAAETSRSARRSPYSRSRLCRHLSPIHRDHHHIFHRR